MNALQKLMELIPTVRTYVEAMSPEVAEMFSATLEKSLAKADAGDIEEAFSRIVSGKITPPPRWEIQAIPGWFRRQVDEIAYEKKIREPIRSDGFRTGFKCRWCQDTGMRQILQTSTQQAAITALVQGKRVEELPARLFRIWFCICDCEAGANRKDTWPERGAAKCPAVYDPRLAVPVPATGPVDAPIVREALASWAQEALRWRETHDGAEIGSQGHF